MMLRIGESVLGRRAAPPNQVFDPCDKDTLVDIAYAYEQLARLTEAELASKQQSGKPL